MRHVFFDPAYNRAVEEGSFLMERVPILAVGDLKSELSRWTDDTSVTFYSPLREQDSDFIATGRALVRWSLRLANSRNIAGGATWTLAV
jgi:hypothetical protein